MKPSDQLMVSHLQKAHILAMYVSQLQPVTDILHLDGKRVTKYVDAIARRLRQLENKQHDLSDNGSWSRADTNENRYEPLRKAMTDKTLMKIATTGKEKTLTNS